MRDYGGGDGAVCFTELMDQKPSNRNDISPHSNYSGICLLCIPFFKLGDNLFRLKLSSDCAC